VVFFDAPCTLCRLQSSDAVEKGWVLDSLIETKQQAQTLASLGIMPKHCGLQIFILCAVCFVCSG